ncbi:ERF family protein [Bradyrhizobium elkanii]|uniref:ERF family protein n=1 Tax=Bradyrhizobium elkanii TaxID=29448 RepID=UPI003D238EDF
MTLPAENLRQIEPVGIAVMTPVTPMALIERAMSSGADMAVIEKFVELHERWEKNQARKSFDEAISGAKAEIPPIQRNAKGHNDKRYADFAAIAKVVDPILSKHGLSYRFRTSQGERISVTCVLSHKSGHSEETTLSGPADASGSKNAIQAIGSTLTYLQRYSLVQMLGLAASNDDDGKSAADGEMISQDQVEQLIALADEVGADKRAFCQYFKVDGIAQLPAMEFNRAVAALNKKRGAK